MLSPPPEPPIANAVAGPTAHNAAVKAAFNAASLMTDGPVVELSDDSSSESESDDEPASESESESLSELLAETETLIGPQPSLPAAKNEDTSDDLNEITAEEFRGSFAIVIPTPSTASSQWAPIPRPAVVEESSSEESEDSVLEDEESDAEPTGDTDAVDAALAASEASQAEMEGLFTQIDAANNARRARSTERLARMESRRAELFGL